jgi:hypothetical protein
MLKEILLFINIMLFNIIITYDKNIMIKCIYTYIYIYIQY